MTLAPVHDEAGIAEAAAAQAREPGGALMIRREPRCDARSLTKAQLAPKRRVWQAGILGMIGGMVAAVTLIEVFAKACKKAAADFEPPTAIASLWAHWNGPPGKQDPRVNNR